MKFFQITLIISLLSIGGCKEKDNTSTTSIQHHVANVSSDSKKHWGYKGETGPEHWKEIEKNSECGGSLQSPINIVNYVLDSTLQKLNVQYAASTHIHDVVNNGHTIQYNFEVGDFILLNNVKLALKQFHIHEPAEHLIDGVRFPMELHLVHQNEKGEYAVLSVMAKEGINSDPFEFLERFLPLEVGDVQTVDLAFDMNFSLPEDKAYFTYMGSLTTPPCTENVQWFIFREPITVSLEQVNKIKKLMPLNNYRGIQPQNSRPVFLSAR